MRPIGLVALAIVVFVAFPGVTTGQHAVQRLDLEDYRLAAASRLAIEGTSTVNSFVCEASIDGILKRGGGAAKSPENGPRVVSGDAGLELIVPVESFDCGKPRMNRDMYEALKASAHPDISFKVRQVEVSNSGDSTGGDYEMHAIGDLNLAGAKRSVVVQVRGSMLTDGRVRARGAVSLLMSDFGVSPPTALLGLVRANDQIRVAFDLLGVPSTPSHASR